MTGRGRAAAAGRRALWRTVLTLTGGLRVHGTAGLPVGPCVIVANHCSHADTAALIAALPARRRPVVAAAADHWFRGVLRPVTCRALCAAFPVRRGGGSADLAAAAALLAAGHDVIVFPEGTRSRDGHTGRFHQGAARLAAAAGVPLVPAGISGTRTLLPPRDEAAAKPRRTPVTVRIGTPVVATTSAATWADAPGSADATARARVEVMALAAGPGEPGGAGEPTSTGQLAHDSALRIAVARVAGSRCGPLLAAGWAFAEALSWPLLPEVLLAAACVAAPKAGYRLTMAAAAGSVAGGCVGYLLAARGVALPQPLTTPRMHAAVAAEVATHGAAAVQAQPWNGIPFKVYAATVGAHRAGLVRFVVASAQARGTRILAVGMLLTFTADRAGRLRRFYPAYLAALVIVVTVGLARVIAAWS